MMRLPSESFIKAELAYRASYRTQRDDVAGRSAPGRRTGHFWHRRQHDTGWSATPTAAIAATTPACGTGAPATRPVGAATPATGALDPAPGAAIVDIGTRRRTAA